jgi:hypothetical protein
VVGVEISTSTSLLGRLFVGTGRFLVMPETQFHGCEVAEKTPLYVCCQISHVLVAPPTPRGIPGTPTADVCQHNLGCPKPCTRSRGQYGFSESCPWLVESRTAKHQSFTRINASGKWDGMFVLSVAADIAGCSRRTSVVDVCSRGVVSCHSGWRLIIRRSQLGSPSLLLETTRLGLARSG